MECPVITASPDHIKALWMNLLANAIQYTPDGGQVRVKLAADPRANVLTATITDTGIGIAAEEIPRIFEEFYRTGEAKSMQETGTGLGLSIVQQILSLYRGSMELESVASSGKHVPLYPAAFCCLRYRCAMKGTMVKLFGGRLRIVLIACFALVAGLTVGLNTLVTSRVIRDYLTSAEDAQIARDMRLARAFYQLKLDETTAISHRLALDQWVIQNLQTAAQGNTAARKTIDQQITNKITVLALGGTHIIAILDRSGKFVIGPGPVSVRGAVKAFFAGKLGRAAHRAGCFFRRATTRCHGNTSRSISCPGGS